MVVYQPPVQHIMAGDRVRVLESCPTTNLRGAVGLVCSGTIESCKFRIQTYFGRMRAKFGIHMVCSTTVLQLRALSGLCEN